MKQLTESEVWDLNTKLYYGEDYHPLAEAVRLMHATEKPDFSHWKDVYNPEKKAFEYIKKCIYGFETDDLRLLANFLDRFKNKEPRRSRMYKAWMAYILASNPPHASLKGGFPPRMSGVTKVLVEMKLQKRTNDISEAERKKITNPARQDLIYLEKKHAVPFARAR